MDKQNKHVKVGNTSFRVEAIKKMKLKDFKDTYKDLLKGQDLDQVYSDVTGSAVPADDSIEK